MYAKKIKRKCGVRGCRNIEDVYAISRSREMGNSVIACKECLMKALEIIEEQNKPIKFEEAKAVEEKPTEETKVETTPEKTEEHEETPKAEDKPKQTRQRKK